MRVVIKGATGSCSHARPIMYDRNGIGFAEMFSTTEHPALAAEHSPWWMNSVPCLARLPFGVSYRQARLDRIMLRRAWRQMRKP